jgi:hypothetical protein
MHDPASDRPSCSAATRIGNAEQPSSLDGGGNVNIPPTGAPHTLADPVYYYMHSWVTGSRAATELLANFSGHAAFPAAAHLEFHREQT